MHQGIQNFSQIMDINKKLTLTYKLIVHREPNFKFFVNNQEIIDLEGKIILDQNQEILLTCYKESGSSAIEINNLAIDEKEILPKYLHLANPQTHWIENCIKWEYKIPKHFYSWYQEITGQGDIF